MVRADKRKYHYIYKTVCNVTGKYYIGMHSTDDLGDGYQGSGKRLQRSVLKYGKENHATEILEFHSGRKEVSEREKELVNSELLLDENCMNLVIGGPSGGWKLSPEQRHSIGKAGGASFANKMKSDIEFKKQYCEAKSKLEKEKAIANPEILKAKRELSVEAWTGSKHSEEAKAKMSESHKGQNNSQFGTCWIYNIETKENKKIQQVEIDNWVLEGWVKGRKKF